MAARKDEFMEKLRIGVAVTGSFCTFSEILPMVQRLCRHNSVTAILSEAASSWDTRFYKAQDFCTDIARLTGQPPITTVVGAEQIGPGRMFDVMLIAPCTGNTLAKINHGIVDTTVTMAAKSHLRNGRPLVIAVSTNDALGAAAINIGGLLNRRNIYFVPYSQDDWEKKPRSMVAHFGLCEKTIEAAMAGAQLQPMLLQGLPAGT